MARTAADVTGTKEIMRIAAAYKPGECGYEQVEKKFGLRPARGMTAYRICQKAKMLAPETVVEASRKKTAEPKPPKHFRGASVTARLFLSPPSLSTKAGRADGFDVSGSTAIIKPPSHAVETLPDSDRYKCRFKVRSSSSNSLYLISFDTATACWKCSCFGCIRHGECKHLRAAGLKGRTHGRDLATLRALG